jgi:hypothetical protein
MQVEEPPGCIQVAFKQGNSAKRGPHDEIQRWVGTSTDIHDQKNLSQRLEQQIKERTRELGELNKQLVIKNNIFAEAEENALIGSYSWNPAHRGA